MAKWYVSIDSKASGPFEAAEVIESIKKKKYVLIDLVFQEGGSVWQSFDEVEEFKAAFEELKIGDESRSKAGAHLSHPWVVLKKTKESGPDKYLQEGPFSSEEVLSQIAKGHLQYSDYLWKKGFEKWIRIGFIPEFDRMRNLSEDSFVDQSIPLPEISDLDNEDTVRISRDEMMKSVQILKKDETYYQKPEDDPDYATPVPQFSRNDELEVTSIGPLDDSNTVPPQIIAAKKEPGGQDFSKEVSFSKDSLRNVFNGDFQSVRTAPLLEPVQELSEIGDLAHKGVFLDLKKDANEEREQRLRQEGLEEATQIMIRPKPTPEKPTEVVTPEKQPVSENKSSLFSSFGSFKKLPLKKKTHHEKRKENKGESTAPERIERRKKKRPTSIFMMLFSIFAILALFISGLYNFRYALFGEKNKMDKIVRVIQKDYWKRPIAEPEEERLAPPPPPPHSIPQQSQEQQTAAQDPNLKIKVESQLESGANQKLPDTNVPQAPAATSESARVGLQRASFIDIDLRGFSRSSKAVLLTNGAIGTKVLVYVSARTGDLLTFPSFYREYKLSRRTNRNMELDLSNLSPGRYNIEAEIGELKKLRLLTVKEDEFNKRIETHLKQVSFEQQKEKKALYYGAKSLEGLLKRLFEAARLAQSQSREWVGFYSGFRQSVKLSLSALITSLNDSNRNNYAYPDEVFDLLDLKDSLLKSAEDLDKDIRIKKAIELKLEQDLFRDFEKIRKKAAMLSVRKVLN